MGTKILLTLVVTVLKLISLPPNTKQYDKKRPKKKKALYEQGDILLDMFALFFLTLFFLNCKYVSFFFPATMIIILCVYFENDSRKRERSIVGIIFNDIKEITQWRHDHKHYM